ncbi:transposase [Lujinxingia vulgaris]|uniref:Transposase n=1 Tax=Lujinxingia vulgaris TaxID=2600176 RepID=A0A5C6X034_9DELT|nr:transposase [Lujinxingia vulgaris]TXD33188.1 transposase [Lujinxingia vulgaris]
MSRQYPKDFKTEAVRLSNVEGRSCVQVADELGIPVETLYRWRRECREDGEDAFPGRGNQTPEQARISELEREVQRLRMEREILKKAMSIFADKERA